MHRLGRCGDSSNLSGKTKNHIIHGLVPHQNDYLRVAQLVECFVWNEEVIGSSPIAVTKFDVIATIAQLVERRPDKPCVVGSSPASSTKVASSTVWMMS